MQEEKKRREKYIVEQIGVMEATRTLKRMRKAFGAWYEVLSESKSKLRKASAVIRWKRLNKSWRIHRKWKGDCIGDSNVNPVAADRLGSSQDPVDSPMNFTPQDNPS
jgi:hypothetical protein